MTAVAWHQLGHATRYNISAKWIYDEWKWKEQCKMLQWCNPWPKLESAEICLHNAAFRWHQNNGIDQRWCDTIVGNPQSTGCQIKKPHNCRECIISDSNAFMHVNFPTPKLTLTVHVLATIQGTLIKRYKWLHGLQSFCSDFCAFALVKSSTDNFVNDAHFQQ